MVYDSLRCGDCSGIFDDVANFGLRISFFDDECGIYFVIFDFLFDGLIVVVADFGLIVELGISFEGVKITGKNIITINKENRIGVRAGELLKEVWNIKTDNDEDEDDDEEEEEADKEEEEDLF